MDKTNNSITKRKYYLGIKYLVPKLKEDYLLNAMSFDDLVAKYNITLDAVEFLLKDCKKDKRSKPEITLREILANIYPNQEILEQYQIGSYFIDIYIPNMRLGFEYDGEFHFNQNDWVHGSGASGQYKFEHAMNNDKQKDILSKDNNIYIIRLSNKNKLNVDSIRKIIDEHFEQIMDNLSKANSVPKF